MNLFAEFKQRNVFRVAAAYVVTAWLVIQVVETILPAFDFGVAVVRYVTITLAVGFIPALVLAWVFEWTPEGIRRESKVDDSAPATRKAAKRFDRWILVILALALGYFAFDKFVLEPQRQVREANRQQAEVEKARQSGRTEALVESYGDQSIAVLAFEDLSPEQDQDYFSAGISEEVLNLLARVPELRVISRSSSFTFKGKNVPIPDIAEQLNAAHILEGSVRKSGDRIRITAQLIEARSDTHLWSQTYDRTLDDVFAIQDEIASDVVRNLELTLTRPLPSSRRTDPEAYALTLQARQLMELYVNAPWDQVAEMLDRALDVDPSYVPAMEAYLWLEFQRLGDQSPEFEQRYRIWRDRILALDPDNGIVHSWIAWGLYQEEHDLEGAASVYRELIHREPNNPEVLRVVGGFLRRTGKFEAAARVLNRCMQVDPLKHGCTWHLKEVYFYAGDLPKARALTDRLEAMWGMQPRTNDFLLLLLQERFEEVREWVERWLPEGDSHFAQSALAMVAHAEGNKDGFESHMARFWGLEPDGAPAFYLFLNAAGAYAYAGEFDAAFEHLDQLVLADRGEAIKEVFSPMLRYLRGDPRWDAHLKRLDMAQERLAAIEFEVPETWTAPELDRD